ncbi:PKD domain-containing protein [Polaribacter ponticola]|uniref:PKD domain-containing protein n=1 Tax=Polaribacter ponticola TaxID=2978475 RepID=A0ABT5S8A7_9FLAO|nr:PKD domain-containing protein [Polaribacter sp. MSW5]MDD7914345.1 PKD domain-containing protein [Polaribacter sp. MSW5]
MVAFSSCEDNVLPETGSLPDVTPPQANFSATQGAGAGDIWKTYSFSNQSSSAISYSWDFGDGNSSTDFEPIHTYSGEGTWTVSLTAKDGLDVESTFTQMITVEEPPAPAVADPVLINTDFTKQAKSSGSNCACSGWINKSIGSQGESTSGNGGSDNVVKFDNDEPDATYQEFEVTPNADYKITIVVGFDESAGGSFPSNLELRILAGSGYDSGYTPTYYPDAISMPQDGYGYSSVAQVETAANNLYIKELSHPGDKNYNSYTYTFNVGNNTSVALYMRGVGGDDTSNDSKVQNFNTIFNNGDEEIQVDSLTIEAVN